LWLRVVGQAAQGGELLDKAAVEQAGLEPELLHRFPLVLITQLRLAQEALVL
jgi:hypothetical protein